MIANLKSRMGLAAGFASAMAFSGCMGRQAGRRRAALDPEKCARQAVVR
ncbi:hypothetical protein MicloDRAFT_00066260 [Microvirga lotononidis]|uniref:Lipoprotein n=1 Tax=Microvirga lotononidis TaxID=864069 RepID=I4YPK5_9HYPH|nr:hypothetical protein MicloDRAFT_00066260 [Microvirga lotononidis]